MKTSDYQTHDQAENYYKKRFSSGLSLVNKDEIKILKELVLRVKNIESKVFLDVGTGTGRAVKELLKLDPKRIYALDSSTAMLKYFGTLYSKPIKSGKVKVVHAKSYSIPLDNNSVDTVTSLHLFKHLKTSSSTIKEVSRVLKPGGYFIFDVLNKNSIVQFNLGSCYATSFIDLKKDIEKYGFIIQKAIHLHPLGETIYNLLGMPGAKILNKLDQAIHNFDLKIGTKIIILAQKK